MNWRDNFEVECGCGDGDGGVFGGGGGGSLFLIVFEVFRVFLGFLGLRVWRELGSWWWRWWLRKVSCQKMGKAPQMLIAWWVALHFSFVR